MNLEIAFGVPEDQKNRAVEILYEAFENKFRNIFGSREQSILLISKYLRNDRIVVATNEGIVVGVGGLKFGGKEFVDMSFGKLLRDLKFGILRVMFLGLIFYDRVEDGEILLDTLAVAEDMRGKGIGSSLINYIIDFACSGGYKQIRLSVTGTNNKAKKLYERIGFKEGKVHRIVFPWNEIFGFDRTSEMVYRVG